MIHLGKCDKEKIKFIQKTISEELSVIDEFGNRQEHEDLARLYFELVKIKERRFDMIIKI